MKATFFNILLALVFVTGITNAQSKFSVEYQALSFFDKKESTIINPFSPDMSSGNSYDFKDNLSNRFLLKYQLMDNLDVDLVYSENKSEGNNQVENYTTIFKEYGIVANLKFYSKDKMTFYLAAGYSTIDFKSNRYLNSGSDLPHSTVNDEASVDLLGATLKRDLTDRIYITINYFIYNVLHDGFDGWDNGTKLDELSYRSMGIGFDL
tara:strand:- start:585 stop:1208 length:624 start_codon:yes stop_codon:yes gene_type:complete